MSSTLSELPDVPLRSTKPDTEPFPETNLIDQLLREQQSLQTPVARFSNKHDRHEVPDQQQFYKDLIPLSKPEAGEQYAFHVELDKCTSCKACVTACHSLNGLDENEAWRDVGMLLGGEEDKEWQQTITSACHHCGSPECMHGCPVGAYDKDAETGIVRHLDDQCIGCQYCILKCPFDVPKYSEKRGIVRKCDMCYSRLAEGEAPACVQACPNEAISIRKVNVAEKKELGRRGNGFLVGAPSPHITLPTTTYSGRNVPETAYAADQPALRVEHMHWPLVAMLTLTQIGVGFSIAAAFLNQHAFLASVFSCLFVFAGLGLGAFHLGRPLGVWRFFLGLKTSWLSREFAVFGAYSSALPLFATYNYFFPEHSLKSPIGAGISLLGLAAVFTSVMIYADTKRPWWSIPRSSLRFYITTFAAGAGLYSILNDSLSAGILASMLLGYKILTEYQFLSKKEEDNWSPLQHTAQVLKTKLQSTSKRRMWSALAACILFPFIPILGLLLLIASELMERALFFQAVYHPRMPGHLQNPNSHH